MLKRSFLILMIACLVFSLIPASALAATSYNINAGSVTISASGSYVISGTGTSTTNTITVAAGVNANITLQNVKIDVSGTDDVCAFCIANSSAGNVNITVT